MAADTPPGMDHNPGTNIAVSLSGDDGGRAARLLGQAVGRWPGPVPLEKQMWGDEFGMCVDQFGIGWMVNIAGRTPRGVRRLNAGRRGACASAATLTG